MKERIIDVEGMSCAHCKQAVEESVGQLIGVKEVVASPEDNQVRVVFEDPASIDNIENAIFDAGYEVI
ncbi:MULTISPECIES: copper ion binding protein [Mammaliicoccus]|jgi:copper chaperone|uniref:Copper ion binding protein n=1 Tax=Mammaliicoccus lentus TaxID=42858 RepID=A0AAP1RUH3_MAMLE|nr:MULTISPECIES: copper ion binding protein [Mammaliicoccus]HBV04938.1 heavy-metal-associated domain-containing protein [Staphylococcus sp.]MBF0748090.1 heavy-metal-associated domain-containing protein [Mammaliicoccus lentus]MBF0794267.1 heavy-metal-associated domain-containing protein [Mammaliicoccus lentus]MBF0842951.1 heavy-metal-associated domain-containing protein [Mammaliicoccus lentus]MBU6112999.1 copper ion binding protein [Mammaliicoccus lentus]